MKITNIEYIQVYGFMFFTIFATFLFFYLSFMSFLKSNKIKNVEEKIERFHRENQSNEKANYLATLKKNNSYSSLPFFDMYIKQIFPNIEDINKKLYKTGFSISVGEYILFCCLKFLSVFLITLHFVKINMWLIGVFSLIISYFFSKLLLNFAIRKRTKKFILLLPEALDLIVRGVRSGLPSSEAIKTIAVELSSPLNEEFQSIVDQMQIGVSMDEAMWNCAKRLDISEFNFMVISMSIQKETGGNIAEILEKLSDMLRRREQMKLKIKAMSSEARASALIIGSLPFIMCGIISYINPKYMNLLFIDPRGWAMIGVGLTSMIIGLAVMSKMVRFEV